MASGRGASNRLLRTYTEEAGLLEAKFNLLYVFIVTPTLLHVYLDV